MTREKALKLVEDENQPRYENIRWYLDVLGMDFAEVIKIINMIPRKYQFNENITMGDSMYKYNISFINEKFIIYKS